MVNGVDRFYSRSPALDPALLFQDQPQSVRAGAELQLKGLQQRLRSLLMENNETSFPG
jgi:hypothetical protein